MIGVVDCSLCTHHTDIYLYVNFYLNKRETSQLKSL
uniref:Uncharacterized protein n=1 Tax=Anguilla anguilla TaxID=7936 RepID=A0A0E9RNA1_ANGAN